MACTGGRVAHTDTGILCARDPAVDCGLLEINQLRGAAGEQAVEMLGRMTEAWAAQHIGGNVVRKAE